jgi:hypothetical protein
MPPERPERADLVRWPETGLQQPARMEVLNPLAVGYIALAAGHALEVMGVDQIHRKAALFEQLK